MFELPKSMLALSWATSVFCVQQIANLFDANGSTKAMSAIYQVESTLQQNFDSNPILFAIDQTGNEVQRTAVDLFGDFVTLKLFDPRWLASQSERAFQRSLDTATALFPVENLKLTWEELRNTFGVINLVNQASSMLSLSHGEIHLAEAIDRAYSIGGDYAALWLVEGLGEEYALRNSPESRPAKALLTSGQAVNLPEKSLLMMHAGMGITFARQAVSPLTPYSSDQEVSTALHRFVDLVQTNARQGYDGPAFESLGLVTRTWYPQMVPSVDRILWAADHVVLEYFWHGVGRAVYFNPLSIVPGASPFQQIAHEAPHRLALLSGTAGTAWAFALVNLRQPEITLHALKNQAKYLLANDAFTDGLVSVMLMATDMLPTAPFARQFSDFQPSTYAVLQRSWDRVVRVPVQRALTQWFPVLKRSHRLSEVFRYQNLELLVAGLEEKR